MLTDFLFFFFLNNYCFKNYSGRGSFWQLWYNFLAVFSLSTVLSTVNSLLLLRNSRLNARNYWKNSLGWTIKNSKQQHKSSFTDFNSWISVVLISNVKASNKIHDFMESDSIVFSASEMEEWSSSQGQSADYSKLGVRESENWNCHCYSQLTPVVPKLHWRKERLEAIQGGGFAKDIFLNKSMYSQALIHTTQTSSITSACLNPALSLFCYFRHRICSPSFSHTQLHEQGLTCDSDIWKGKLSGLCTFWWVCKNIHKMDFGPF